MTEDRSLAARLRDKESPMLAYHGRQDLKDQVLALMAEHREADRLAKGVYWQHGKGCAVGCTLESVRRIEGRATIEHGSHALYERYLGVPRLLARLEDAIFEALPNGEAQAWPERFLSAIHPGADLSMVWPKFIHNLLTDPTGGVQVGGRRRPQSLAVIQTVSDMFGRWIDGAMPSREEWQQARAAAAAHAADAAAYAVADASAYAVADASADAAADAAAYAVAYAVADASAYAVADASAAAYAAAYAVADASADASADAAAYSAAAYSAADAAAADASADAAAARTNERRRQADVLIRLLQEAR